MGDDDRLKAIEDTLRAQGKKLDDIGSAIQQLATQQVEINDMRKDINALWKKWDSVVGPEGLLVKIQTFQASCPRNNIKWVWFTLIPMAVMMLAMGAAVLKTSFGG